MKRKNEIHFKIIFSFFDEREKKRETPKSVKPENFGLTASNVFWGEHRSLFFSLTLKNKRLF
jgi:hypothetical protein